MSKFMIIKDAAQWWANCIEKPVNNDLGLRGGDHLGAFLGEAFADIQAEDAKKDVSQEQIELFKQVLEWLIERDFEEFLQCPLTRYVFIKTDYGPQKILKDACRMAGIPYDAFPLKTVMWICENKIEVRQGLGAEIETINVYE